MTPSHRPCPARSRAMFAILLLVIWFHDLTPVAISQTPTTADCVIATEPNDEPFEASELGEGARCATADPAVAGTDFYHWVVPDSDQPVAWTFAIPAIPGAIGVIGLYTVEFDDQGRQTAYTELINQMGVEDQPHAVSDILLAPGEYFIAVAYNKVGPYQLTVSADAPLPETIDPGDDAWPVTGAFGVSGATGESQIQLAWTVDEATAGSHHDLVVRGGVGETLSWYLTNPAGVIVYSSQADVDGRSLMPDLGLDPGAWLITITRSTPGPWVVMASATTPRSPSLEDEPNDSVADAQPLVFEGDSFTLTGRIAERPTSNGTDIYAFTINAAQANRLIDFRLISQGTVRRSMCLNDASGVLLGCAEGETGAALNDLTLPEGGYLLTIYGPPAPGAPYILKIDISGPPTAGFETEPNHDPAHASPLLPDGERYISAGRLEGDNGDIDHFRIPVSGPPQLWRIEATGGGVTELGLIDANGQVLVYAVPEDGTATLSDVYLPPGDYVVYVRGSSGEYTISATPLGPAATPAPPLPGATPEPLAAAPDPLHEQEPNDSPDRSQPTRLLEVRTGRLATETDVDFYRFSLQGPTFAQMTVTVPAGMSIDGSLDWNGRRILDFHTPEPGLPIIWSGLLQPGDYSLQLSSSLPGEDPYSLVLTPLDPFTMPADLEPNDTILLAIPIPATMQVSGTLDPVVSPGDTDWYVLPAIVTDQVMVTASGENVTAWLHTAPTAETWEMSLSGIAGDQPGTQIFDIPPDQTILLEVRGTGDYTVAVTSAGEPADLVATPAPGNTGSLSASLDFGDAVPAAFWHQAQLIDGVFRLTNSGDSDATLDLASLSGHTGWRVDPASTSVTVAAGATAEVAVAVTIPPDAWAGHPIAVALQASSAGVQASAMALLTPQGSAIPVNSIPWEPLPPALLGGLDVAWTALGGLPVTDADPTANELQLYDQLFQSGYGWRGSTDTMPVEIEVDLAGAEPIPVAGVILFPAAYGLPVDNQVRDFELDLSTDGETWTTVLQASLPAVTTEQAFALDVPVDARFARLRILSTQLFGVGSVVLGELKVVATPGWSPGAFDLAAADRGGHIVDFQPALSHFAQTQVMLDPDGAPSQIAVEPGSTVTWVVGFNHDRAAQITSIEWSNLPDSHAEAWFTSVLIEVSTGTPLGPWTSLGEFQVSANGELPNLTLDTPTWARFVRFTARVADLAEGQATVWLELPERLRITESPVDDEYRSILGEWGTYARVAIYERTFPADPIVLDPDAGNDAATATLLGPNSAITNSAAFDVDEDWYRVEIPPGDSQLVIDVAGIPALGVTATLFDDDGTEIPLAASQVGDATLRLTADVEPGASYTLRIVQPTTSIVFAFDTSGSIGGYQSTVYQGLFQFANGVLPGHEFVNLLPFGESLLLDDWTDQYWEIQAAVNAYARSTDSSEAEEALQMAMSELERQTGNRAIVIVTDAESGHPQEVLDSLWTTFDDVRPRVFAIQIAGGVTHAVEQDLMQDWSMVNSGDYVYVRNQGEMDIAFDRAATALRRPAIYSVSALTRPAPPAATPAPTPTVQPVPTPAPVPTVTPTPATTSTGEPYGSLVVVSPGTGEGEQASLPASQEGQVAIILDTSGSMLQQMDGQSRADIAKTALIDLVTTTIPPGTTVSLRTFGDTPDSCNTDLAMPPGPLDPATMAGTMATLPIVNLVRTPIGAALDAVVQDLAGASGPKVVVLVTDGEETCDGDPAAAIAALVASGIDVRVNIVGFAIDDAALQTTFAEWADLGNGQYFDAANASELNRAVAQAILPAYEVIGEDGSVVATGLVDSEPVSLPPGTYTIVIRTTPEIIIENVVIESATETTVVAAGP